MEPTASLRKPLAASLLALMAAAALAVLAPAARAVPTVPHSVTYSFAAPTGYVGTVATSELTDFDTSFTLPQINPSGDVTLTSIVVTLSGGVFGDFSATNPTSTRSYTNQTANVSASITVAAPDPSGTALGVVLPLVSQTFSLSPNQTVSQSNLAGSATVTQTTNSTNPDFAELATYFIGTGTISLPVSAAGTSKFSGAGNVRFAADTYAGASATVTLNYLTDDAIPISEPRTVAILGMGLIGLGAARLRQRSA